MKEIAIEAFTDAVRDAVLASRGVALPDVEDLGGFESVVYRVRSRSTILRATHTSHRSASDIRAELEWLDALAADGAPVCQPVLADGDLLTTVDEFLVCEFEAAPGRLIEESDWGPSLFSKWGEALGRLHQHAKSFSPKHRRIQWTQDENFFVEKSEPLVRERMDKVHAALNQLPVTSDCFGLIHCDAHAGNFFLQDGKLTFFDFDDACYCWFGYDAATVLFSAIRQPWMEHTRDAEAAEAARFLPPFIEGYATQADPAGLLPEAWPLFLTLREIGLYDVIKTHAFDPEEEGNDFAATFMAGRLERIEAGEPHIDLDFGRFF